MAQPEFTGIAALPEGLTLEVNGDVGPDYALLASTNLSHWEEVLVTNPPVLPFSLLDTNVDEPRRFYQLRLGP